MSSLARQRWSAFVGVILLFAIGGGIFIAIRSTFRVLDSLKSDITVAIIAAGATTLVSILTIVLGKVYESRERIQNQHRERKIPIYEELLQFLFRTINGAKIGNAPSEKETMEFIHSFNQKMMVWGADGVVSAWVRWLREISNTESMKKAPFAALALYEDLIFAIRRDLGHKNKALKRGDLLRFFVNDIDQYLPPAGG
jgi:uncharacterized protein YneF (UPF0154 family)